MLRRKKIEDDKVANHLYVTGNTTATSGNSITSVNIPTHSHGGYPGSTPYTIGGGGNSTYYPSPSPHTQYPMPLGIFDMQDPNYINAMVNDILAVKGLLEGLLDRITALQERIEMLEDDLLES